MCHAENHATRKLLSVGPVVSLHHREQQSMCNLVIRNSNGCVLWVSFCTQQLCMALGRCRHCKFDFNAMSIVQSFENRAIISLCRNKSIVFTHFSPGLPFDLLTITNAFKTIERVIIIDNKLFNKFKSPMSSDLELMRD